MVGDEMFLYLIDELTGKPVVPTNCRRIHLIHSHHQARSRKVEKLLPAMQVGLHAVTGQRRRGRRPTLRRAGPKVPAGVARGRATSVEILKQESSVEKF